MFSILESFFTWLGLVQKEEEPKTPLRDANGRFVSRKKK